MKNKLHIAFMVLVAMATFTHCRKDPPPLILDPKDPCSCVSRVSAEFDIIEVTHAVLKFKQITDNVLAGRNVIFSAKESNAEYTWTIGAAILTDSSVTRYFDETTVGFDIPITLEVRKTPNINCFPDDDGYDKVTKIMRVYEQCDTNIMEGSFRMAIEGTVDSVEMAFNFREDLSWNLCDFADIYNYDELGANCIRPDGNKTERNYRWWRLQSSTTLSECNDIMCEARLDLDGVFTFDIYFDYQLDPKHKRYKGRKLY